MRPRLASAAIVAVTLIAAAVTTPAAGGSPARAGESDDSFAGRLFAGNLDKQAKSYACFVRVYDAAHLKQHRLQKVSAMKLLLTAEQVPEDEALNYSFRLGVSFRHRPGDFDSSGDCGHIKASESEQGKTQLGCSVDCDGGGSGHALISVIRMRAVPTRFRSARIVRRRVGTAPRKSACRGWHCARRLCPPYALPS
jgi:hypothetical protein